MKYETKQTIRRIGVLLFIVYVLLLAYFLFFSEWYGRTDIPEEYRYNLIPFVEIQRFWTYRDQLGTTAVFMNIFGNIIGFVPFGFIFPIINRHFRNGFLMTVSGCALSLSIELLQLATKVGSFDVDDIMTNTLGTFLGFLIFWICDVIRSRYHGKKI